MKKEAEIVKLFGICMIIGISLAMIIPGAFATPTMNNSGISPNEEIFLDQIATERIPALVDEWPGVKIYGFHEPHDGDIVSEVITVVIYVPVCNCSGVTKLYIDGVFQSNGTFIDIIQVQSTWVEVFHHTWDTTTASNDLHELVAFGKHDEFVDEISVEVVNIPCIYQPKEGDVVAGVVDIIVYVPSCNCSGVTKLYMEGFFHSNGIREDDLIKIGSVWVEVFHHTWDTTLFSNGEYSLLVLGKHDEFVDRITITVEN